ncbi:MULTISPECIES: pirin family protein [Marinomonas]|uniref:pirin family protein n=1 Tax=Marinomonas TaxID=28253 RepID=UPI0010565E9C|nr:pirin family protein [Marinomonas flavescens]
MSVNIIKRLPLKMFWPTLDPFLFCAFHNDDYPKANPDMGPDASLQGRPIGQDFQGIDGWRMYHGRKVPGFPVHPHRGFETITIVNEGFVDHSDSLGSAGRYGKGDTQWMTAGKGVQHSEMFPLLKESDKNPLELFQVWLNLPAKNKMVPPHFAMLWREDTPIVELHDEAGITTSVRIIAGELSTVEALPCPPDSWAAEKSNDVAIWVIDIPKNGCWTLPKALAGLSRMLYFFEGEEVILDGTSVDVKEAIELKSDASLVIENVGKQARFLLLQGRPIEEPIQQRGPFVMNTKLELQQAVADYQRTQFGGWPWSRHDQVHDKKKGRFAHHVNGLEEQPDQ